MPRTTGKKGSTEWYQSLVGSTAANIAGSTIESIIEELKAIRDEQKTLEESVKAIAKALIQQVAQLATSFALLQLTSQLYSLGPGGVFAGTMISTLGGYVLGQGVEQVTGGLFGP